MTTICNGWLVVALATSLVLPATLHAKPGKRPAKITVHPQRHWHGYGFLPGYRQPDVDQGVPRYGVQPDDPYEVRYWHYGQWRYGYGRPRFYGGRWNGGSFGPCWTQTPIGPMWNCGQ